MTLDEIKAAVDAGKTVYHKQENYEVRGSDGQYLIVCTDTDYAIGLTWRDGVTLNGQEYDFYVKGSRHSSRFFVASNGDLCRNDRSCEVVREKYAYHHQVIETGKQLCATLRAGPYAWPGGYPLFIGSSTGESAHFECVKENLSSITHDLRHNQRFGPMYCEVNYENVDLYCDCCSQKIESAYGDDDEEE